MRQIIDALPPTTFSSLEKRSRAKLDKAVTLLPPEQLTLLEQIAVAKVCGLNYSSNAMAVNDDHTTNSNENFLETVSEDCRRNCISNFIDATGNNAIASSDCAVCGGCFFNSEIYEFKVSDLKEKNKLVPSKPHPAQNLTDGMLLHTTLSSLHLDSDGCLMANVCSSCSSNLKRNKMPAMSLANGLWIGEVPPELKILTLPERILIACFFLAAYIVKLYPKKKGARNWASDGFYHALRGNVSTYRLSTDQIAELTSTDVMPPSPTILAATIGVTFVGPKNVPKKTMPGFLRVNRMRVRMALEWLKEHNPLYSNITISSDKLNALPVNGVPDEIMSLVKYSDDTRLLAEETDGYVPSDYPESDGKSLTCLALFLFDDGAATCIEYSYDINEMELDLEQGEGEDISSSNEKEG